jgi:homogentisate 1,2-dioxygenase
MIERAFAGEIPRKHHIVSRGPEGALRHEECFTRDGFSGGYTIVYHLNRPHTARIIPAPHGWESAQEAPDRPLARRHYKSWELAARGGAPLDCRLVLMTNEDLDVGVAFPSKEDPAYFANGDADELVYIFAGTGTLRTVLGDLRYGPDDYVGIPRGLIHRWIPDDGVKQHWLTMECKGGFGLLKQFRNELGQLTMDAPYCHRDFRGPEFRGPLDEGLRLQVVKKGDRFHGFEHEHTPLDVVGWDGAVWPFVFPMLAFQARAGLTHLPPTWHGTFAARNALICSFVPRTVDFHPEAIPCPYPHSSVDCDELIFYCRGNFTSRRGVSPGSISFHPAGIPHGPHPGAYEASIGHLTTSEQAVMIDTLRPLRPTGMAMAIEDHGYHDSFR